MSLVLAACSSSGSDSGGKTDATSPAGSPGTTGGSAPLSAASVSFGFADTAEGGLMIRVADSQGYWKELGLNVKLQVVPTGPAQLAGLAGGSLQFAQTGPSTTMVPIQQGQAKVKFIGATQPSIPWQLVISKSFAASHDITADTDPETIIPKLQGARFAGVSGPTDSIATVQGYMLAQYGVTDAKTDYLGSPASMFATLSAGRADAYIDVLGQSFQAKQQSGALIVDLADLKKLPYIANASPSYFTATKAFIADHPDTVTAFLTGLWKAWTYVKDPANHDALVSFIQKQYAGTPTEAAEYFIKFNADKGMWMSEEAWQNSVNLANTTLEQKLTLKYTDAADDTFEKAAVAKLGLNPPGYSG